LDQEAAAKHIGLCPRSLRALPIPVCRPNRRKLYEVRDLDSYMRGVKCLQSRLKSGSTAKSFLELLAAERAETQKNGQGSSKRRSAKTSPADTSR
jgi:hypothetical protein